MGVGGSKGHQHAWLLWFALAHQNRMPGVWAVFVWSSTMQNTNHIAECCFLRPVSHEGCNWANHNTEGPKIIYCVLNASSVFGSEFLSFGRTPTAESCTHNCSPKVAETNVPGDNHNVHNITALMPNCLTFSCHPVWAHKVTNAAHTAQKRSTDPPKTAEAVLSSGRLWSHPPPPISTPTTSTLPTFV